jgi:hypothetical protein
MYNEGTDGFGTCIFDDLDRVTLKPKELSGLFGSDVPVQEVETEVLVRRGSRGTFIRGPFPLSQVCTVGKLPGKALLVWLLVHHRTRMTRQPEVTLPNELLASAGVDSRAKARALVALERAGLVQVRREPGKSARIALTMTPDQSGNG